MTFDENKHLCHRKQTHDGNQKIDAVKQMQAAAGETCQAS